MSASADPDLLIKLGFRLRSQGDLDLLLRLDRLMDVPDATEREQLLAQLTQEIRSRKT